MKKTKGGLFALGHSEWKIDQINTLFYVFSCGSAAQRGPWPPHSRSFYITRNDAPQSVGLLWTCDQPVAESST